MNKDHFLRNLATQGAVGYGQAPGTIATIMTIPLVWFLASLQLSLTAYVALVVIFFAIGWYIADYALPYFDEPDPNAIVIDEMVAFIAVFCGVPFNVQTLFVGFVLFRLLDIYKPLGIAWLDRLPGVSGVMLDDMAAALITNGALHLLVYYMRV